MGELKNLKHCLKHRIAGNSCPRPGQIVHGEWTCEEQQVPIPDTVDLTGELETFPGDNI